MDFIALGDSALVVRLDGGIAFDSHRTLQMLDSVARLQDARIPGVIEYAPAYTSIAVFFEPAVVAESAGKERKLVPWLAEQIRRVLRGDDLTSTPPRSRATVELAVCYDAEFAFDVEDVARHSGLSVAEVVRAHASAEYTVASIGFMPGFPYLTGLPPRLATPRHATPRKQVPAGSVGIGGAQTGIYPAASPGGWNIIGRIPVRLFDPTRRPPSLLRAGDRVRVRMIARAEFDAMREEIGA